MKSFLSLIAYLLLCTALIAQQSAPQHFNYQTLIRNTDGTYVANASVYLRVSILKDTPTGEAVYMEVHQTSTNDYGLINLKIGEGTTSDDFTMIDWGASTMFVKIEASIGDDQNYFDVGVSPFSSVPYALFAEKSGTDYKVPSGTGILSFNPEAPEGYGFSGNTIETKRLEGDWETQISMPHARRYAGVCASDEEFFVIGGEDASSFTTNYVESYNVNTNTWDEKPAIPVARNHTAAVSYGGKLYVSGGFANGINGGSSRVDVFDPETEVWMTLPEMNIGRWAHSMFAFNDKLYVVGGMLDFNGNPAGNVETYDFNTSTWTIVATIPDPIKAQLGALVGEKFYLLCGSEILGDSYTVKDQILEYDIKMNEWNIIPSMHTSRISYAVGEINNRLVVSGGILNGEYITSSETYDPITNTWFIENDISGGKTASRGATINNEFWIFGGQSPTSKLDEVERLIMNEVTESIYLHVAD